MCFHEWLRSNETFINEQSNYVIWICLHCDEKRKTVFVKEKKEVER